MGHAGARVGTAHDRRARTLARAAALAAAIFLTSSAGAPAATYRSPGYKGPTHRPVPVSTPLPPVSLGSGKDPAVLVDAAGTGHILFSTDGGASSPDTVSYCRLARGQTACATTSMFSPQAPPGGAAGPFEGNLPSANHDFDGPVPLVINDQLAVVDRRFPDVFTTPGGTSESNVFLWTSNDGGTTFTGGALIGDNEIGGGAVVYGTGEPAIGTISRTQTTGTTFQGSGAGQYTTEQALLGPPDEDYDGSLAVDGGRPVAAFDDANGTTYVREWSGSGDVNDAANWSTTSFPGSSPRLAGGPGGTFVLYRDQLAGGNLLVRSVSAGQVSSTPVTVVAASSSVSISDAQIAQDAAGHLVAGWITPAGIDTSTSADGTGWTAPQLIAAAPAGGTLGSLALAATTDGGGFAVYVANPSGAEGVGTVMASAMGSQLGTGQPGLADLAGGGIGTQVGDSLATATCTDVTFGAVHAVAQAGCFLHDSTDKTGDRVVSLGTVDVNGIYLVPDAGAEIEIDPRLHTIDTIGSVSVVLRGGGLPDITLWHGSLDAQLPTAAVGDTLFDLKAISQSLLEGFGVDGDIDAKLTNGGVSIPISLTLPSIFGGVTGNATLVASLASGLQLTSLEIKVPDVVLGVAELKGLDIMYTQTGDVWKGTAEIDAPAGGGGFTLKVDVEFDDGQYKSGSVDTSLPPPCGIPLDPDEPPALWLQKVGLGVALAPVTITGGATFGIVCPGDETADTGTLDGTLTASFGSPITLTATATGKLYGIQVESGTLVYKVPDYVSFSGESGISLGPFSEMGQLQLLLDPASKKFGGSLTGAISIEGVSIPSYALAISNDGFGACLGPPYLLVPTEVTYHWGDVAPAIKPVFFQGCPDVTALAPSGSAASTSRAAHAHGAAAAGASSFTVAAGTKAEELSVTGQGGAPTVVLTAPDGTTVTPTVGMAAEAAAIAYPVAASQTTYVGIMSPAAGTWTVNPAPGSVALTGVVGGQTLAVPSITASVVAHGHGERLTYTLSGDPGLTATIAESGAGVYQVLATVKPGRGTINFTPAAVPGAGGARQVVATLSYGGTPRAPVVLAHFQAPAPARPARATGLHAATRGSTFAFSWRPAKGAVGQLVTVVASDGRHVQELLAPHVSRLSVPVIGFTDRVRVTVATVGSAGARSGAVAATAHATLRR